MFYIRNILTHIRYNYEETIHPFSGSVYVYSM